MHVARELRTALLCLAGALFFLAQVHLASPRSALAACRHSPRHCLTEVLPGTAGPYLAAAGRGVMVGLSLAFVIALLRWGLRRDAPVERAALREAIPARIRHEVWRRDDGTCVECHSRERLEFDHIVPVSRGGANTVRNLELRCEPCNRRKGSSI